MESLLSNLRGIDEARVKLAWAKRHLHLLDEEITKFLNRPPYCVRTEDDLEAGEYCISLSIDPITSTIVLILGDFVSCLRGSLDHLACQLTSTPEGAINLGASFPILRLNNNKTKRHFDSQVRGIPVKAVEVIESLQPFHAGQGATSTKLWQLHRLWNIDKHRRIPAHSTFARLPVNYPMNISPTAPWDDNSGVVRFPLSSKAQIHIGQSIDIGIRFGDESEGIVVNARELTGIYDFVDQQVFSQFEGFFSL